jgi:hypothetical protein
MSDNKDIRAPQDAKRIALGEDYEVRYWSGRFGVTPEQLRDAVEAVGNSAEAVGKHLAGR